MTPLEGFAVQVGLAVACGHLGCVWSMPVNGDVPGQDAMAVHAAYLDHLDTHYPDHADCESVERSAPVCECGLLEAECNGLDLADPAISKLHTRARELARQLQAEANAVHDAEVTRALAEDGLPGPITHCTQYGNHPLLPGCCQDNPTQVLGLYAGMTAEQVQAEQARIDRFMAGGQDA